MNKNSMLGSIYGLMFGDVAGKTLEFTKQSTVNHKINNLDDIIFETDGQYTDDTEMAICIMKSIIEDGWDVESQIIKYIEWLDTNPYDVGITIHGALTSYKATKSLVSPYNNLRQSGNGTIMRLAPVVMYFHDNKALLLEETIKSSQTTHASPLVDVLVTHMSLTLLKMFNEDMSKEDFLKTEPEVTNLINKYNDIEIKKYYLDFENFNNTPTNGDGFVKNSLQNAYYYFLNTNNFTDGLIAVIKNSEDTDTVAAIYGQIAGAYYGYEQIIKELQKFIDILPSMEKEDFDELVNIFLQKIEEKN